MMKKTFAAILVTAASLGLSMASSAATNDAKASYKAAKDSAAADYKVAHAKCDSLSGNGKDVCIAEAKAARVKAEQGAEVEYKHTAAAQTHARKEIADADYDVAKAKCDAKAGNDKDVCIKEAKAAKTAAVADAKADKKVADARNDAADAKRDAQYKVAAEKCDALSGAAKDGCVANAKSQFGK